jgi:hypothetical protein
LDEIFSLVEVWCENSWSGFSGEFFLFVNSNFSVSGEFNKTIGHDPDRGPGSLIESLIGRAQGSGRDSTAKSRRGPAAIANP